MVSRRAFPVLCGISIADVALSPADENSIRYFDTAFCCTLFATHRHHRKQVLSASIPLL